MREYELLYIVSGDKTEEEAAKVTDAVNEAIQKVGGKVTSQDDWGRRRLAYEVDKQSHGWYVITRFEIDPPKLDALQKALNILGGVIRTVTVKADEIPSAEETARTLEAVEAEERDSKEKAEEARKPKPATAEKPAAEPAPAKPETKKAETAEEKAQRQAKLEEKLGELLKDDE